MECEVERGGDAEVAEQTTAESKGGWYGYGSNGSQVATKANPLFANPKKTHERLTQKKY